MSEVSDDGLGVRRLGHRVFVGGDGDLWARIGKLQFEFLKQRGLRPDHVLLDFACGSLRAGLHLVPYLAPGNYLGFDKSFDLVMLGIAEELGLDLFRERRPEIVINGRFDLSEFSRHPDFVIAQSIFTHLTPADIEAALRAIGAISAPHTVVYATFFLREPVSPANPALSHSRLCFYYEVGEMASFGARTGWDMDYIGNWNHPRGQVMCRFARTDSAAT